MPPTCIYHRPTVAISRYVNQMRQNIEQARGNKGGDCHYTNIIWTSAIKFHLGESSIIVTFLLFSLYSVMGNSLLFPDSRATRWIKLKSCTSRWRNETKMWRKVWQIVWYEYYKLSLFIYFWWIGRPAERSNLILHTYTLVELCDFVIHLRSEQRQKQNQKQGLHCRRILEIHVHKYLLRECIIIQRIVFPSYHTVCIWISCYGCAVRGQIRKAVLCKYCMIMLGLWWIHFPLSCAGTVQYHWPLHYATVK